MIDMYGDSVSEYMVDMGRTNDLQPRIVRNVYAKCDYMAAAQAERLTPGYIAFKVYRKEGRVKQ